MSRLLARLYGRRIDRTHAFFHGVHRLSSTRTQLTKAEYQRYTQERAGRLSTSPSLAFGQAALRFRDAGAATAKK